MKWWSFCALALLLGAAPVVLALDSQAQSLPQLDGRIEIVWPQGEADPLSAERANITVYLFKRGTLDALCAADGVQLLMAKNNEVVFYLPGVGYPRRVTDGNLSFTAWDFNDVDVSLARNAQNRLYFQVRDSALYTGSEPRVGGKVPTYLNVQSNVWAHAANPLTFLPMQEVPIGTHPAISPGVVRLAPKIQIVWPHGGLPVNQAEKVNITATIFHQEALASMSVPPEYDWSVELYGALNQEPLRPIAVGQKRLVTANGVTYPVWDFNNIDVSVAKDPRNKYFFQVKTSGSSQGSNIWVHGADGRTYFPQVDIPTSGCD